MRGFFAVVIVLAGICFTSTAQAFSIKPARHIVAVDPGKEQIIQIIVKNTEAEGKTFTARVGGVRQDSEGRPVFGDGVDAAEGWITPIKTTFPLRPGEEKKIFFSIKPPAGTEPGTHASAILVRQESGGQVASQAAALLVITVAGVVEEKVTIENWKLEQAIVTKPKSSAVVQLKNNGTVGVLVTGKLRLIPIAGGTISEHVFSAGNIMLPGTIRQITIPIDNPELFGGPYRAEVSVRYGLSQSGVSATTTFWYLPWWMLAVGGIVVVFIVFVCSRFIKRLRKK